MVVYTKKIFLHQETYLRMSAPSEDSDESAYLQDETFLHADNDNHDHTARRRRLFWVIVRFAWQKVYFLTLRFFSFFLQEHTETSPGTTLNCNSYFLVLRHFWAVWVFLSCLGLFANRISFSHGPGQCCTFHHYSWIYWQKLCLQYLWWFSYTSCFKRKTIFRIYISNKGTFGFMEHIQWI